ncbi:hypothetical protein HYPSUDRAFT_656797 [Hypholoma sublateritium FD-334 SS-4]|uniref:Uncharacterized protein n=1 Tax=Hypholoma sublateritium (strain FD-334 SS-4) TaxID=945553 RepID=A0A0D2MFP1_HYPSF|nr:hypothetical protein HYPSUDRAFT_656797 [Hypholoma sublateritium FD-334 SS-4]
MADSSNPHQKKKQRNDTDLTLPLSLISKMAIFIRACLFIFLAIITAMVHAAAAPGMKRRDDPPDLTSWFKEHNNALSEAVSNDDIRLVVDAYLSPDVNIQINGLNISRSDFINSLLLESSLEGRVSHDDNYLAIIEVPMGPESNPEQAGCIGAFFKANGVKESTPSEIDAVTFSQNVLPIYFGSCRWE